jgi:hypothetical protein
MPKNEPKVLSNKDILESQGLVEIYDPSVGAYRQVAKEEAKRMVENLEKIKASMEGKK